MCMAMSKLGMNLIFGLVVAILGTTVLTSLIRNRNSSTVLPPAAAESRSDALPENHPPIDAANKLMTLEQMAAKDPQNADYRTQIGNVYYDLGQYDRAADYYRQSLGIRPRDPQVETDLATCLYYTGRNSEALRILNKVFEYSPGFRQAMFNKGVVLINGEKDVESGISVWEELLRLDPAFPGREELEKRISQLKASIR